MGISQKLGELNCNRYNEWRKDANSGGKQAALAFTGDVYMGLGAWDFTERQLTSLQRRVRILSGLVRVAEDRSTRSIPTGWKWAPPSPTQRGPDLYSFWGQKDHRYALNERPRQGHRNKTLVNLASNEYWRVVNTGPSPSTGARTRGFSTPRTAR